MHEEAFKKGNHEIRALSGFELKIILDVQKSEYIPCPLAAAVCIHNILNTLIYTLRGYEFSYIY